MIIRKADIAQLPALASCDSSVNNYVLIVRFT